MSGNQISDRMPYTCACGREVDVEIQGFRGGSIGGFSFQHCAMDERHTIPGPIIAVWEKRDEGFVNSPLDSFD
ncbi:MAG: hypothetical protein WCA13_12225 [Terriglobales bacterium]